MFCVDAKSPRYICVAVSLLVLLVSVMLTSVTAGHCLCVCRIMEIIQAAQSGDTLRKLFSPHYGEYMLLSAVTGADFLGL